MRPVGDARGESGGPVPRWWLWATSLTVALAAGTWLWTEALHLSPTPLERYVAERAAALDTGEPVTEQVLADLARDKLAVRAGEGAFARNCARCHGAGAEGNIGPNLTDDFWIGGGAALDIYQTILRGRDGKGMPSWGLLLGTADCKQLAAYVVTLRGANRPGKAPQGARWSPAPPAK
ncbi:MAG TPA: c-type cytochrome [Kofleriaceae bacterium]|nr:c-type cytochrome [Kofleriaceae bacterium]